MSTTNPTTATEVDPNAIVDAAPGTAKLPARKPRARRQLAESSAADQASLASAASDDAVEIAKKAEPAPSITSVDELAEALGDLSQLDIVPPVEEVETPPAETPAAAPLAAVAFDDLAAPKNIYDTNSEGQPDQKDPETGPDVDLSGTVDEDFNDQFFAALADTPEAAQEDVAEVANEVAPEETPVEPIDAAAAVTAPADTAPAQLSPYSADIENLMPELDFAAIAAEAAKPAAPVEAPVEAVQDDADLEDKVSKAIREAAEADAIAAQSAAREEPEDDLSALRDENAALRRRLAEFERRLDSMEGSRGPAFSGHIVAAKFTDNLRVAAYRAETAAIGVGHALRRFFTSGSIGLFVGKVRDRVCMPALRVAKAVAIPAVVSYAAFSAVEDTTGKTLTDHVAGLGQIMLEQGVDAETAANDHFTSTIESDPALEGNWAVSEILEILQIAPAEQKAQLAPETSIRPMLPSDVRVMQDTESFDENMMSDEDLQALGMNSGRI